MALSRAASAGVVTVVVVEGRRADAAGDERRGWTLDDATRTSISAAKLIDGFETGMHEARLPRKTRLPKEYCSRPERSAERPCRRTQVVQFRAKYEAQDGSFRSRDIMFVHDGQIVVVARCRG